MVENLTQSHKFEGLNTAAAFIGGRKNMKKFDKASWPTAIAHWLKI